MGVGVGSGGRGFCGRGRCLYRPLPSSVSARMQTNVVPEGWRRSIGAALKEDRPQRPAPPTLADFAPPGRFGQFAESALIRPFHRNPRQIKLPPPQRLRQPRTVLIAHALRNLADRPGTEKEETHGRQA